MSDPQQTYLQSAWNALSGSLGFGWPVNAYTAVLGTAQKKSLPLQESLETRLKCLEEQITRDQQQRENIRQALRAFDENPSLKATLEILHKAGAL